MPIVEPEVLMDADNTIESCDDVTGRTLRALFAELYEQDVHLRGTLLKPNMVIAGKGCPTQAPAETVARADGAQLHASRAGARPRDRLPLGRPARGPGDREPERDQPARRRRGRSRSPTGARCRRPRSRRGAATRPTSRLPSGVPPPCADERARGGGRVERGPGAGRARVTALETRLRRPRRRSWSCSCLLVSRGGRTAAARSTARHAVRRLRRDGDGLRPGGEADPRPGRRPEARGRRLPPCRRPELSLRRRAAAERDRAGDELGSELGRVVVVVVGYNDYERRYEQNIQNALAAFREAGVERVLWATFRAERQSYLTMNEAISRRRRGRRR